MLLQVRLSAAVAVPSQARAVPGIARAGRLLEDHGCWMAQAACLQVVGAPAPQLQGLFPVAVAGGHAAELWVIR